ncbi:alcohol dehydrogenase catalytic domain-containing protein [Lipingzhangella sp. LS1_29]|uniref:Alcohol dehydrogenase catalytic domain-containing protein n=1 Tax=Lipingzhangella rawalii TaxID=2055835 RepID=A0ABU2HBL3_9ACTN|nr:alcohol dehydrogenase catalytic domain-containing protein [Lipingzhangella rawalii]MDS1272676.1 alcohol dehydrogenase catalytic domain-containing protein [Lipingzhangella rawalii]
MKAWEIRDGHLDLHEVAPPRPSRQAITAISVRHSGICGSDLPKLRHPSRFTLPAPWRPGHEIVGTDPTGRTVAIDPLVPCQTCPRCAAGDSHLCPDLQRLGWDLPGGFAEEVRVPTDNAHPLPTRLDPLHAVLADPTAVAAHGLRCAPIRPPGRLAVVGAGTIGLLTALYARWQGWEVTVFHREGRAPSPAVAKAIPADCRLPLTTDEKAFDVVVDAASGAEATPLALALGVVRDGGSIVVQNAYDPDVALPVPLRSLFRRSIRLIGSFSHCRRQSGDFHLGLTLLNQHADSVAPLIAEVGHLTDLRALLEHEVAPGRRRTLTLL